ncbi:MAG: TolC family protein [Clostridia bacterium]|nr:TolC family protein [Clostridia bacterium]
MKKFILILCVFFFVVGTYRVSGAEMSRSDKGIILTYNKALGNMIQNNRTIKKLDIAEEQAYRQYLEACDFSSVINTTSAAFGIMVFTYDEYTRARLEKQKYWYPKHMKFVWETVTNNKAIAIRNLTIALRGQYLVLSRAYEDVDIKKRKLDIAAKLHTQNLLRYKQGTINNIDIEESEYNLNQAQEDFDAAIREKENACRNINMLMGVEINTIYKSVEKTVTYSNKENSLKHYTDNALLKRLELLNLQREMDLNQLQIHILERTRAIEKYTDAIKEYKNLLINNRSLELKMEKSRMEIQKEIEDAYVILLLERAKVRSLKISLETQKKALDKMEIQYKNGYATKINLEQFNIGVQELKNAYSTALFNYNTKLMQLENAAGLGPAYMKG